MKISYLLPTPELWCRTDTEFEQRAQAQPHRNDGAPAKIKQLLLTALTALGLASAGDQQPSRAAAAAHMEAHATDSDPITPA